MILSALAAAVASITPCWATAILVETSADNTLYVSAVPVSNGGGSHIFTGRTLEGHARRAVLRFDLTQLPPGTLVTSAQLQMVCSRRNGPASITTVHRLLNSWGEGSVIAPGEEGSGGFAFPGDATWDSRFYPDSAWATPGGDFVATPSASATVDALGPYSWGSTPELVADVQSWIDDPATNFGWLVHGDESASATSKRFESRESPSVADRPRLLLEIEPTVGVDAHVDFSSWGRVKQLYQ